MAGTKHKTSEKDMLTKPELLLAISKLKTIRDKALASFIYMTDCRISEIVGCKKVVKNYIKKNKRFILNADGSRVYEGSETKIILPLRKESIEFMVEKKLFLVHNVPCLKRINEVPKRNIPVFVPLVPEFYEHFRVYYNTLQPEQPLFSITRQRAWQIMNKVGIYNHFLIHERLTHLVGQENLSDHDLKIFRGWSSTMPANHYVHLRWQDLAKKQGADID